MKQYRRRLVIIASASIVLGLALTMIIGQRWPLLWVDLTPIYQKWDRPQRPPHPIEIYRPPGDR